MCEPVGGDVWLCSGKDERFGWGERTWRWRVIMRMVGAAGERYFKGRFEVERPYGTQFRCHFWGWTWR